MNINTGNKLSIVPPVDDYDVFAIYNTNFSMAGALQGSIFKNVQEMDDELVRRWNSVVKKNDIVLHLGNFGNLSMRKKLNGIVFLIPNDREWYQTNNGNCYVANYSVTEETKNLSQILFYPGRSPEESLRYQSLLHESFNIWGVVHDQSMYTIKCEIMPNTNYFLTNNVQWKDSSSYICITGGFVADTSDSNSVRLLNANATRNRYTPVKLKDNPGNICGKDGIVINGEF